jgi:PPOX class probable F420-dependent enzyme
MAIDKTSMKDTFAPLANQQFILLTTFRKDGRAVPTPVWFALDNGALYITTMRSSGKVKRIRHNSQVTVVPCDRRGNVIGDGKEYPGHARELPASEHGRAHAILARKYGLMYRIFMLLGRKSERTYLEVVPV